LNTPSITLVELLPFLKASLEDLRQYAITVAGAGGPRVEIGYAFKPPASVKPWEIVAAARLAPDTPGHAQMTLHWLNPAPEQADAVEWDRVLVVEVSAMEFLRQIRRLDADRPPGVCGVAAAQVWAFDPKLPQVPPLWRYHPQRLFMLLPFGRQVATLGLVTGGKPTAALAEQIRHVFMVADQAIAQRAPLRYRARSPRSRGDAARHYDEILLAYACYQGSGRQLYDVPAGLTALFRRTDIDGIALEQIKLPVVNLYLHFGPQADLDLGNGWKLEGAYVQDAMGPHGRHLNLVLVAAPRDLLTYIDFDLQLEPCCSLAFGPAQLAMPVGVAAEQMLAEQIAVLRARVADLASAPARSGQAAPAGRPADHPPVPAHAWGEQEELARLLSRRQTCQDMLKLVVNALAYISTHADDIDIQWPIEAPEKLTHALRADAKPRDSRNALTALTALGFSAVHRCGARLVAAQAGTPGIDAAERPGSAHWIRGCWRSPPRGAANAKRRLEWVMPVIRGLAMAEIEEPFGHAHHAG
jgi:hypothetical protein